MPGLESRGDGLGALAELVTVTGSETVAFGFDLESGQRGRLRLAGLLPRGLALDEAARQRLDTLLHARSQGGLELELTCSADDADRWSCDGTVGGFGPLIERIVDQWESQIEQSP